MRQLVGVSVVTLGALLGGGAHAGVVISAESANGDNPPHSVSFLLEPDRLREVTGDKEMIYRADLGKFWTISVKDRTYDEVDRATLQKFKAQADDMKKKLREQMASMPEAQRKEMEAILAQQDTPPAAPAPPQYEKIGEARKLGPWTCTPYRVVVEGTKREELCLVKMSDVGLARDDLKAFASLSSFVQDVTPQGARSGASPFSFDQMSKSVGFDAFPVLTTAFTKDGTKLNRTLVKAIEHKSIAADTFEVPKDFTERKREQN